MIASLADNNSTRSYFFFTTMSLSECTFSGLFHVQKVNSCRDTWNYKLHYKKKRTTSGETQGMWHFTFRGKGYCSVQKPDNNMLFSKGGVHWTVLLEDGLSNEGDALRPLNVHSSLALRTTEHWQLWFNQKLIF